MASLEPKDIPCFLQNKAPSSLQQLLSAFHALIIPASLSQGITFIKKKKKSELQLPIEKKRKIGRINTNLKGNSAKTRTSQIWFSHILAHSLYFSVPPYIFQNAAAQTS